MPIQLDICVFCIIINIMLSLSLQWYWSRSVLQKLDDRLMSLRDAVIEAINRAEANSLNENDVKSFVRDELGT
jgi:flagellar basal body-associated protein FliL